MRRLMVVCGGEEPTRVPRLSPSTASDRDLLITSRGASRASGLTHLSIDNRRNESVPAADSVQSRSRANGNEKNFRSAEALPA